MKSSRYSVLFVLSLFLLCSIGGNLQAGNKTPVRKPVEVETQSGSQTATTIEVSTSDEKPEAASRRLDPAAVECKWRVLSGGGAAATAGDLTLGSTIGQPAVGLTAIGDLSLHSGYWQDFGGGYLCGDTDASGAVNIADVVYLIAYIFGGPAPQPMASANVDCSETVNIADAVYLVAYIFGEGPDPCDPDGDGVPGC